MEEDADDHNGGGGGGGEIPYASLPAKAQAVAQMQEGARVNLYRALNTVLHMLVVRGFVPVTVNRKAITGGLQEAKAEVEAFRKVERVTAAQEAQEVVIDAVSVASGDPSESGFYPTTAWALGLDPGTKLAVVVVGGANVDAMRAIVDSQTKRGVKFVIVLHRDRLTPYAKKFLPKVQATLSVEVFQLCDLQAPIDTNTMTPPHYPVNAEVAARVRDKYRSGIFPKLLTTDPMVRFLGMKEGGMIATHERYGRGQPVVTWNIVSET